MAFKRDHFAPVHITTTKAPSIFIYGSEGDLLSEVMEPGYFKGMQIVIKPGSMIDVVCKDHVARIIAGPRVGLNVTMRAEYFLATDPYASLKANSRKRATPKQVAADKAAASAATTFAKTG